MLGYPCKYLALGALLHSVYQSSAVSVAASFYYPSGMDRMLLVVVSIIGICYRFEPVDNAGGWELYLAIFYLVNNVLTRQINVLQEIGFPAF